MCVTNSNGFHGQLYYLSSELATKYHGEYFGPLKRTKRGTQQRLEE